MKTLQSHLNCVDEAENLDTQADGHQLTVEERNFPRASLEPVGSIVEQLRAEEKSMHQERKKALDGDTFQEVDTKEAVEEGTATQENVLKQGKKSEVIG